MKRGDVVLAAFPFQDMPGSKIRPTVVLQNDADKLLINRLRNFGHAAARRTIGIDPAVEKIVLNIVCPNDRKATHRGSLKQVLLPCGATPPW